MREETMMRPDQAVGARPTRHNHHGFASRKSSEVLRARATGRRGTADITSTLNTITELAVRLNALEGEAQRYAALSKTPIDQELERVATRLDQACAQALRFGVALHTPFITTDRSGRRYVLTLTEEGVEYQVA